MLEGFAKYQPFAMVPVRIALGVIFMAHGGQKLLGWWHGPGLVGFASFLESFGMWPPTVWAAAISLCELVGGGVIFVGYQVRLAALVVSLIQAWSLFWVHWPKGLFLANNGYEYNLALLALTLALLLSGPGRFAVSSK